MAENDIKPVLPTVTSQEGALVGDENLPEPREYEAEVNQDAVRAQVVAKPEPAPDKVQVFEVAVQTDKVITDPSDPLAVQVPDAGRGSLLLPIHSHVNAKRPEDVFASDASEQEEPASEEKQAQAASEGRSARPGSPS